MGGKTSTSTQSVSIPPEVLARYNAVNARAENVAQTPFQQYGGQFVAGLTPVQQQGIQQTSQAATLAQPYYGLGAAYTMSGAQDVGPLTQNQIGYYESPYTQAVAAPTYQALRQQQGQELAQQQAQAIRSGAAFGDRAGLERANLQRQQALGTAQALAPIYQQGYGQAVQTAQQQQNVIGQDLARRMQAGQQIAGLGTGAQQAALQGAQAALAAGTAEQQTQQADLTARYQQFLQERGYPFQVAQFLANIAMGTGALSGSTTTTQQPAPFFSDKRLKHDAHRIGETDDGLPIYSFKYNGDDKTQIGLMAQDVEKRKPEAVGLAPAADGNLYKTVDYEKATRRGRDLGGPVNEDEDYYNYGESMGGAVDIGSALEGFARGGYAVGGGSGLISSNDWKALLANIGKPIGAYGQDQALGKGVPFGGQSFIDPSKVQGPGKLATAGSLPTPQKSGLGQAMDFGKQAQSTYQMGKGLLVGSAPTKDDPEGAAGLIGGQGKLSGQNLFSQAGDWVKEKTGAAHGGLIVHRKGYSGEDGDSVVPGMDDEDTKMSSGEVNPAGVPKSGFPAEVLASGSKHAELATAKGGPGGGGQSGASGILGAAKDVAGLYGLGKGLYSMASGAGSFLSSLPFLAANGGAINPYAYGGLIPREHHQDGEEVGTDTAPVSLFERPVERPVEPAPVQERGLAVRESPREAPRQEQPNYRNIVIEAAKKHGIDPEHAVRLVQGESGMRPIAGDEGSSGSIFQLHVGNLSKKYPNPGLGDVYFEQRQPELAKTLTPAQKIAYLNDPRNQADIADFSSEYISKSGARPWTVARNQGLFGLGTPTSETGSARRPGYGLGLPESYSGTPARQASLGDVAGELLPKGIPTESSFWVPALGFLGSMLSSRSPYLGAAIGEGLVGGVSAYQAEKKQQMEMAKDLRTMFDQRFIAGDIPNDPAKYGANAGKRGFLDKNTQQWFTPDQMNDGKSAMARELGIPPSYLGVPRAPTRPLTPVEAQTTGGAGAGAGALPPTTPQSTAPATSSQQPSTQTQAAPTATQTGKEPDVLAKFKTPESVYEMEPAQLIDNIKKGGEGAYQAAGLVGAYDPRDDEKRVEGLKRSLTNIPVGTPEHEKALNEIKELNQEINRKYQSGIARQVDINKKLAEGAAQRHEEALKEAQKRQNAAPQAIAALRALANIGKDYEFGRLSEVKATIASTFKSIGWEGLLPKDWDAMPNDAAVKLAFKQAFEQVANSQLTRAPAATLNEANRIVAQPTIDPGAAYQIIGQALGEIQYMLDRDAAYEKSGTIKPTAFYRDFDKNAPYEQYIASAFSTVPTFRGMSDKQIETVARNYKFVPLGQDPFALGKVEGAPNRDYNRVVITGPDGKPQYRYYKKDRE